MENNEKLPQSQRFVDVDHNVEIEIEKPECLIPIKDSMAPRQTPQDDHSGFVVLPTKIPLGVIVVFVLQCIATAISITSIYVEQKTSTTIQNEKIIDLEEECYTKIEANYLTKEVEALKARVYN